MTDQSQAGRGLRVLQRVVFPGEDLDVVPLYVETNPERGAAELAAELAAEALGEDPKASPVVPAGSAARAWALTAQDSRPASNKRFMVFPSKWSDGCRGCAVCGA